jgi:UDP-N-acetylglucosamine 2-epimerase
VLKFKIILVVGARPQFIKLAPLMHEILKHNQLEPIIIHTGQHYDANLSANFFEELNIPNPQFNLEVGSQDTIQQIAEIMVKMDPIIKNIKPQLIIVFGDTNSTAAASIVAAKNNIKLAHVEAGLREWNKSIPEETNKLITDALTDYYFCPTPTAINILYKMGKTEGVILSGDIGMDILVTNAASIEKATIGILDQYNLEKNDYYLVTCHRTSNTDVKENIESIIVALNKLDKKVIFPLHPRTQKMIQFFDIQKTIANHIQLVSPLGFIETQVLIKNASIVLTDSGGIIKEAYFHKTPSVIIDKQTEWVEIVKEGWSKVVGPNTNLILESIKDHKIPTIHSYKLGDGTASKKIVQYLMEKLNNLH